MGECDIGWGVAGGRVLFCGEKRVEGRGVLQVIVGVPAAASSDARSSNITAAAAATAEAAAAAPANTKQTTKLYQQQQKLLQRSSSNIDAAAFTAAAVQSKVQTDEAPQRCTESCKRYTFLPFRTHESCHSSPSVAPCVCVEWMASLAPAVVSGSETFGSIRIKDMASFEYHGSCRSLGWAWLLVGSTSSSQ